MNSSQPKKQFKFFLNHFRPNCYKSASLLKKLRPKVRSLIIPLKGSSSFGDYVLTDILKQRQLERSCFNTLQKVKTWFISYEFLQFFLKNKQILKGIRSFKANINNFSYKRARCFTQVLSRMKNLHKFDDTAKFCVQKQSKAVQYTFPGLGRNTLKTRGLGELSPKPATSDVILKNLHALRKVQEVKYTPNMNFKKLFPGVKRLEIDACYLGKLEEIRGNNIEELRVTDYSCQEAVVLPGEKVLKVLGRFKALKRVTVEISDDENEELGKIVDFLPEQKMEVKVNYRSE